MSRTYRKNPRRFYKFRGEFYTPYRKNHTVKGKAHEYKDIDEAYEACKDLNTAEFPMFYPVWGGRFYKEVIVGDSECYGNGCPSSMKKMHHRIDRARYKAALYHHEDAHILPSFDPWDYD